MKNLHSLPAFDTSKNMLWQQNRPNDSFEKNKSADKTDTLDNASSKVKKIDTMLSNGQGREQVKKALTLAAQKAMEERGKHIMEKYNALKAEGKTEEIVGGIGNEDGQMSVEEWKKNRAEEKNSYKQNSNSDINAWKRENDSELDAYRKNAAAEKAAWSSNNAPQQIGTPQSAGEPKQVNGPREVGGPTATNGPRQTSGPRQTNGPRQING